MPQIDNGSSIVNPEEFANLLPGFGEDQSARISDLEKENEKLQAELRALKAAKDYAQTEQLEVYFLFIHVLTQSLKQVSYKRMNSQRTTRRELSLWKANFQQVILG